MIYTKSHKLSKIYGLEDLLEDQIRFTRTKSMKKSEIWVSWGRHNIDEKLHDRARSALAHLWRLEDGFISYLRHPSILAQPLSIVIDRKGIYYDTSRPSELETILSETDESKVPKERIRKLIERIRNLKISKYNHAHHVDFGNEFKENNRRKILVVDQSYNDRSVRYSGATGTSFHIMLQEAISQFPDADIYVKSHPDSHLKGKQTYLSNQQYQYSDRVHYISSDINPWSLLERIDEVFTVSSQLGFEALMAGIPVHCFGHPFYAGWGLTIDHASPINPFRRQSYLKTISLEALVYAALVQYPKYRNPDNGKICAIDEILDYLEVSLKPHLPYYDTIYTVDLSLWKRSIISSFIKPNYCRKIIHLSESKLSKAELKSINSPSGKTGVLVWGYKNEQEINEQIQKIRTNGIDLLRAEDGFIRSVGLGSDLKRPSSLIVTKNDLHYAANGEIDIVQILNEKTNLSKEVLQRASHLHKTIIGNRLTKYNLSQPKKQTLQKSTNRNNNCLVIGQVPADASLTYASTHWKNDFDLLRQVREDFPTANIYYKPHPDVISGNRKGIHIDEKLYDHLVMDIDVINAFDLADSVHVICSLTGLEALIYNKRVYTYGKPFYAGWGLTVDKETFPERNQNVNITELLAASLLKLPLYMNWNTHSNCQPETSLSILRDETSVGHGTDIGSSYLSRLSRKVKFLSESYGANFSDVRIKKQSKHNRSA